MGNVDETPSQLTWFGEQMPKSKVIGMRKGDDVSLFVWGNGKNSRIASTLLSRLLSRGDTKHSQIMLFCVILQLLECGP